MEELVTEISVKDFYDMVKEQKPARFNKENEHETFNDPRITDFAYVNLKNIWSVASILKKTKVNLIKISVDYDRERLIIVSPDHTFEYTLYFDQGI